METHKWLLYNSVFRVIFKLSCWRWMWLWISWVLIFPRTRRSCLFQSSTILMVLLLTRFSRSRLYRRGLLMTTSSFMTSSARIMIIRIFWKLFLSNWSIEKILKFPIKLLKWGRKTSWSAVSLKEIKKINFLFIGSLLLSLKKRKTGKATSMNK